MKRAFTAVVALTIGALLTASPANATFHIMVIDQVFFGFPEAEGAQYVMLRPEANAQVFVENQVIKTFDANGGALPAFGAFCRACNLPVGSPACKQGGCPLPTAANDTRILVATVWARDLFCVTPDLLATGSLPYPDGRVCFGDDTFFESSCFAPGSVDCVAYGSFTGDNEIFGNPAEPPTLGQALAGVPSRQAQCLLKADTSAVCVGGTAANTSCAVNVTCPSGTCTACPNGSCRNLLDGAVGFSSAAPAPQNYHGDLGMLDGIAGDAEGNGTVDDTDVDAAVNMLFEGRTNRRCGLPAATRGADANLDTLLSAADVTATLRIVGTAS